jgi:peptide/nickel transport system substrate-binding protein
MQTRKPNVRFAALSALLALALVVSACGTAPVPAEGPAASQPAAPAAAPTATPDVAQQEQAAVVEGSQAARSTEVKGVTVTTDEEVASPRTNYGGEYRDVATSDAVNFHPYLTTDTASSGYQAFVYSGALLRLDENTLEYIPNMAESYTISEDGLTFTFNLRQDMKWSDGQPITAHDFQFAYDKAIDPANEFPYASQLEFMTSYKALDDFTIEVKIEEVYAPALGQMSGLITPLPKHVWENLDWKDPEKNPEINRPSVVSGPYKLVEWQRDQFAIFEANESYWYHGRPNFDRYVIEIVPDQDIAYQKMKSGESDTGIITPENLEEARTLDNVTVYEWWPAAATWTYIGMNMRREGAPTQDVNVRQGIAYAIDKELLTEEVMLGQAKRMCSVFPETSWVYNPDVPCYDYDVDTAIAKFEEAGYTYDGTTMLDPDGQPLTLKLIFGPNTNKVRELIAVTVQDYLADIGITVDIQALEWASFLDATDGEDWDLFIGGWRATIEPHIMYTIWAAENIPELNAVGYANPEVEALFEEGGKTYDTPVRIEKYGEVQRIIAEEAPYVFLYYSKSWSGQNNRIQGIIPTALGIGWNSEDWYIEPTP